MITAARMVALLLLIISFIFLLASTTTRAWKEEEMKIILGRTLWYGLFEICEETSYEERCNLPYEDVPGWLHACRALMIMSVSFCGIAVLSSIIQYLVREQTNVKLWMAGVMMILAGICAAIGLIIYTARGKPTIWELPHVEKIYKWSFSYAFGWAGAIVSIFTFIMCLVSDSL